MKYLIGFIFIAITLQAYGQDEQDIFLRLSTPSKNGGKVVVDQDPTIAAMVRNHVEQNKTHTTIEGYRVQIYSGSGQNSKNEAQDVKGVAMSQFPVQKVYLTYTAPFWRVRMGNFRTKSESLQTYYQLKRSFPNCYPVKENAIRIDDL